MPCMTLKIINPQIKNIKNKDFVHIVVAAKQTTRLSLKMKKQEYNRELRLTKCFVNNRHLNFG